MKRKKPKKISEPSLPSLVGRHPKKAKKQRSSKKKMSSGLSSVATTMVGKGAKKTDEPYVPPASITVTTLGELLGGVRTIPEQNQSRFDILPDGRSGVKLWTSGDTSLAMRPSVAIVGSRKVSSEGAARARRLAKELSAEGFVIVSGLAKGVDTEAMSATLENRGKTIGVIGTPITKAYPAENKRLQEMIYKEHLLISQFAPDKQVYPGNFPERNKVMAAISDVTVIIEATDESGSLHQAWECTRLKRWLFIPKSLVDNPNLQWPRKFLGYETTKVLSSTSDIIATIQSK
jgi:DNA processing protein